MKSFKNIKTASFVIFAATVLLIGLSTSAYGDIEFSGGVTAQIDDLVEGSVFIYDANVVMIEPAHILGYVLTGSEAVLDIYGGQIDYMVIISTNDISLPEGVVTVYGTDFAVNGEPVDPNTTELFLQGESLSGTYYTGTEFSYPVDCVIVGGSDFIYYQTVKLAWLVSEPDIEIIGTDPDFGQVDLGTAQTAFVTVYNQGNAALTLQSLSLQQGQNAQFDSSAIQLMPVTIEPNSMIDLEVSFSPVVEGPDTAVLSIVSDDPNDPVIDVVLSGEGVSAVLTVEEQMDQIIDIFNTAIEEGTIEGVGNRKSAKNKVRVFGKMLLVTQQLIDLGYGNRVVQVLKMIEKKCDGKKRPKDFVKGPAAEELNTLINELIDTLREQRDI